MLTLLEITYPIYRWHGRNFYYLRLDDECNNRNSCKEYEGRDNSSVFQAKHTVSVKKKLQTSTEHYR